MEVNACAGRNILKLGGSSTCIAPKLNGELPDVWNLEYEYFKTDDANQEIWFFSGEDKLGHIYLYNDYVQYWFTKTNDDERLWKLLYQGVGINELAKEFGRSEYAIHCRLKKLALEHPVESEEIKDNYNKVFGER